MLRATTIVAFLCFLILGSLVLACSAGVTGLSGNREGSGEKEGHESTYHKAVEQAESSSCQANILSMRAAVHAYEADMAEFPASLQEIVDKGYISKISVCPQSSGSKKPYIYDAKTGKITCPNGHPAP